MTRFKSSKIIFAIAFTLIFVAAAGIVRADDDDNGKHSGKKRGTANFEIADNATYKQECASCHFLYLPGLLPARAWSAIITNSNKHFGENLALEAKVARELEAYLTANSMEKSNARKAAKMLSSIGSDTPSRITDIPYIKKEHRKIKADVFKRPAIQSPSNCVACHSGAPNGDFDEDNVKIPK